MPPVDVVVTTPPNVTPDTVFLAAAALTFPIPAATAMAPNGTAGQCTAAIATGLPFTNVIGILALQNEAGKLAQLRTDGPVTFPVDIWQGVTYDGNALHPGTWYYASDTIAGQITNVKPSTVGHYVAPIGFATSTVTLLLARQLPIVIV
jgi:hypothetical protein